MPAKHFLIVDEWSILSPHLSPERIEKLKILLTKNRKVHKLETLTMPKIKAQPTITPQQIIDYLATRPSFADVTEIKNILEEYLEEINYAIEDWRQLLPTYPDGKEWGDKARKTQFQTIVTFLQRQGFIVGEPELWNEEHDPGACCWELCDDCKEVARLHWSPCNVGFFVSGHPALHDREGNTIDLPTGLDWI